MRNKLEVLSSFDLMITSRVRERCVRSRVTKVSVTVSVRLRTGVIVGDSVVVGDIDVLGDSDVVGDSVIVGDSFIVSLIVSR